MHPCLSDALRLGNIAVVKSIPLNGNRQRIRAGLKRFPTWPKVAELVRGLESMSNICADDDEMDVVERP